MARYKRYIEANVLDEAKRRLHHIFDIFDSVAVMFSGGKDSLACLHLVREVQQERGIAGPVHAVFRDEELIPFEVIEFVDHYRQLPWLDLTWYAIQMKNEKFILGRVFSYVQWDRAGREWIRPKPAWAVDLPPDDDRILDQYKMDTLAAERFPGKVAFVTGIRAQESLIRYRASVNKLNDNYITRLKDVKAARINLCKPLFDWQEDDIFKYFHDREIRYCPLYDAQLWAKVPLRISTVLHAESAKNFDKLRAHAPDLYQRVIDIFPEMLVQERYWRELDREAIAERYGGTYEDVRRWIDDYLEGEEQAEAIVRYDAVMIRARNDVNLTPRELLRQFVTGQFRREMGRMSNFGDDSKYRDQEQPA
jgi:predicted phosphoadenosine phosphosulfate sulfurtransferase